MTARTKAVTLSDGTICHVIAPNRLVRMAAGQPPQSFLRASRASTEGQPAEYTDADLAWLMKYERTLLVRCVFRIEGKATRLVDKPFAEAQAGELSVEALNDADLQLLLDAINGLDKEVGSVAASFRGDAAEAAPAPHRVAPPREELP